MKKILLFATLFMALGSFGQTADYLENNPRWRQLKTSNQDPCMVYNNFVYHIDGDSVVGSYTYKKVYKYGEISKAGMSMGVVCTPTTTYNYFSILIRQDDKKLFVHNGMQDSLLYDFDLTIGDTLPITYNNWENNVVITSMDSMLIDGSYRDIFYWDPNGAMWSNHIIEGVGSDAGLLEYLGLGFSGFELLCYEYNGVNYLESGTGCEFNVDVDEIEPLSLSVKVHPIPAEDELTVKFSSPQQINNAVVVDALGRSIELNFTSNSTNEMQIDVAQLNDGIYFLILTTLDGQSVNTKIVIHSNI